MIPFSPPRIDQKIIDAVTKTLQSGWITTGPQTKEFERRLAEYNNVPKVLAVNSATSGMELILRWWGIGPGDEVIVPAYTYCATANVVIHCGAKPVMVDCDEHFNIDPEKIRDAITEKTKAIIPVDIAGWPCNYEAISKMVQEEKIKKLFHPTNEMQRQLQRILVMADAAHSLGAKYKGEMAASFADIAVFSLHAVKNLTTAEGGAICLNMPQPFDNEDIYKELNIIGLHGQTKDALAKTKKGAWEYDVVAAGYKYNMPDILAAIGLVELERYENDTLNRRREIFNIYTDLLKGYEWAIIPQYIDDQAESSYHLYQLRIKDATEQQRNEIIKRIFDMDVSVNVHFKPLPMMTFYKEIGYKIENFPMAFINYQQEISLPVYYNLFDEDVKTVVAAVVQSVEEVI